MDENERNKVIGEVIEAVKSIMWSWFENNYEYSNRCKQLENEIAEEMKRKAKEKEIPQRAIQTPFWDWICPNCRQGIGLEYECSKCGQKILWKGKEQK